MSGEGGLLPGTGPGTQDQESRWKQYLEDERIALFLQNEEFMKELQRNRDFLLALERGGTLCGGTAATSQLKKGVGVGYNLGAQEGQGAGGHGWPLNPFVLVGAPEFCHWGPVTSHPFSLPHTQGETGVLS